MFVWCCRAILRSWNKLWGVFFSYLILNQFRKELFSASFEYFSPTSNPCKCLCVTSWFKVYVCYWSLTFSEHDCGVQQTKQCFYFTNIQGFQMMHWWIYNHQVGPWVLLYKGLFWKTETSSNHLLYCCSDEHKYQHSCLNTPIIYYFCTLFSVHSYATFNKLHNLFVTVANAGLPTC